MVTRPARPPSPTSRGVVPDRRIAAPPPGMRLITSSGFIDTSRGGFGAPDAGTELDDWQGETLVSLVQEENAPSLTLVTGRPSMVSGMVTAPLGQ